MLKDGNFVLIECFAKKSGEYFAICRAFRNVVEIDLDFLGNLLSAYYILKLREAGSLDRISVEKLLFKTIVVANLSKNVAFRFLNHQSAQILTFCVATRLLQIFLFWNCD